MKRGILLTALVLGVGVGCSSDAKKGDRPSEESGKGTVVAFDNLKSKTPDGWKAEPAGGMRKYQFRVPKSGGGDEAELVIYSGIGGSARQNIDRWKGQFEPPAGKDEAKVEELKVAGCDVLYLDVSGTYNPPPMAAPDQKGRRPNYRMLGVHFEGPQTVYHIKFTGPAATIEEHKKGFDEWLKGFK